MQINKIKSIVLVDWLVGRCVSFLNGMPFAISFAVRHSRCLGMQIKLAHSYINILIMSMREMEMENVGHFGSKEIKTEGFISMIFVQEEFSIVKRHVWSEFQMRCVFMCASMRFILFLYFSTLILVTYSRHLHLPRVYFVENKYAHLMEFIVWMRRKANFGGQPNHLPLNNLLG